MSHGKATREPYRKSWGISVGDQRVNAMEMGLAVRYAEPRWQPDTVTIGW